MTKQAEQLLEQLRAVDPGDFAEVMEAMEGDAEHSTSEYLRAWEQEIEARLDAIDSGKAKMIPHDEFLRAFRDTK